MIMKPLILATVLIISLNFTACSTKPTKSPNIYKTTSQWDDVDENETLKNPIIASLRQSMDRYLFTRKGGDCSGFVTIVNNENKALYFDEIELDKYFDKRGRKSQAIFNLYDAKGKIYFNTRPKIGDLIFFEDTTKRTKKSRRGYITHVGIVREIYKDGSVEYVHNSRGKIKKDLINLRYPNIHQQNGKLINSYIVGCSNTSCLGSNRFAGYGKVGG